MLSICSVFCIYVHTITFLSFYDEFPTLPTNELFVSSSSFFIDNSENIDAKGSLKIDSILFKSAN